MRVTYTNHARQRMALRGITQQEVESVLAAPDTIRPSSTSLNPIHVGHPGGRRIEVVIAHDVAERWHVITVRD